MNALPPPLHYLLLRISRRSDTYAGLTAFLGTPQILPIDFYSSSPPEDTSEVFGPKSAGLGTVFFPHNCLPTELCPLNLRGLGI